MIYLTRKAFEEMVRPLINDANIQLQQFYKAFGTERSSMIAQYGWFTLGEVLEAVKFTEGEIEIHPQHLDDMVKDLRFVFYYDGDNIRKFVYSYGDFVILRNLTESDYEFYRGFLEYDKFKGIYSDVIEDVGW